MLNSQEIITQSDEALVESANQPLHDPHECLEKLKELSKGCRIEEVKIGDSEFSISDEGTYVIKNNNRDLYLSKRANQMLLKQLGMPYGYFSKMPNSYVENNVNHHFHTKAEEIFKFRFDSFGNVTTVLALNDNIIDNKDLFQDLLSRNIQEDYNLSYFHVKDEQLNLRFVNKHEVFSFDNDPHHLGIYLKNSEYSGQFDMGLMFYRMWCSNGAVTSVANLEGYASRFTGLHINEFRNRFNNLYNYMLGKDQLYRNCMEKLKSVTWSQGEWTQYKRQQNSLGIIPKSIREKICNKVYAEFPPANGYELFNKITSMSQSLSPNGRLAWDSFAGKVISTGLAVLGI